MKTQIALQLYTIRDEMKKDFVGALRRVAKIGYAGIEGGSTGPLSLADYKALLKELNLNPMSTGAGIDSFTGEKGRELLARCRELGTRLAMVGWEKRDSAEGWQEFGRQLTQAGKAAKAGGVTLQYHNHAHEFVQYGGKAALDIVFDEADPAFVKSQLDVGWVQRAGEDPVAWLKKLGNRIRTIHIKDTTGGPSPKWTEVGTGILPLAAVHECAQALGVEWYIIEQDEWDRPSLEAAAISYENTRKLLER